MGSTTPAAVHLTVKLLFSTAAQEFCQVFIITIISSSNVLLVVSSSSRSASLTAAAGLAPGPSGFERRILAGNEKADKAVIHPEEQLFLSSTDPVWHSDEGNVPYFLLNYTTTLTTVEPVVGQVCVAQVGGRGTECEHDGRTDGRTSRCLCDRLLLLRLRRRLTLRRRRRRRIDALVTRK